MRFKWEFLSKNKRSYHRSHPTRLTKISTQHAPLIADVESIKKKPLIINQEQTYAKIEQTEEAFKETFWMELVQDPVDAYKKFALNPYEAPESKPLLLKILKDINQRLEPGSVLELDQFSAFQQQLNELRKQAVELINRHIPLTDLNQFVLNYVETMDKLFRYADPTLQGSYHRDLAKGYMHDLLHTRDGTKLFFTTHAVDDLYLLNIRPSAMYLNWVLELPPFKVNAKNYHGGPLVSRKKIQRSLDGLKLDVEEITKHDLGHSFFMKRQDKWLFETSGFSRLELVKEWTENKNRILSEWQRLSEHKPELAKAARFILFEIIHDKGYQYNLSILRQQIHSSKWEEIIRFKNHHGYYGENKVTENIDQQLYAGRIWLLNLIENLLMNDNQQKIESLMSRTTSVDLRQWKTIENHQGVPRAIDVHGARDFRVCFDVDQMTSKSTSLYLISLVLAPVAEQPILSPEKIDLLEQWIWKKKHSDAVSAISFDCNGEMKLQLKAGAQFPPLPKIIPEEDRLTAVEKFKLERLLFLMANKHKTSFTTIEPPKLYRGKVINADSAAGQIEFLEENGNQHLFSLVEISIQPVPAIKVAQPNKYINLRAEDRFVDRDILYNSYIPYQHSLNSSASPFVTIDNKYELGIVDTMPHSIAKAVSSVLTRSLEDAKYSNGGYLPPSVVERVQRELISPHGITHLWGKTGHRFVLSREAAQGKKEIISTALVHHSRDGIFFFTSEFNNLRHSTLGYDLDFNYSADGIPEHKWFDKFCFPDFPLYKPRGFHHFANFVVEKENARGLGLARLMINEIVKNYSREYIDTHGTEVVHSQKLLCGSGFWQIGDPPWLARMSKLGFYQRLGCETFHVEQKWAQLLPTFDREGKVIDNLSYNRSFGLPERYFKILEKKEPGYEKIYEDALNDPKGQHLFFRIPKVIEMAQNKDAKLQYFQLIYPFTARG